MTNKKILLWHATERKNLESIMMDGLKCNIGEIYFSDTSKGACAFLYLRSIKNVIVLPVEFTIDEIEESFDHSPSFFESIKCFTVHKDIPNSRIIWNNALEYNFD